MGKKEKEKLKNCIAKATTTAKTITQNGGQALAVVGDILDDAYIQNLVKQTAEFGGDGKIHIIVNNAGFTWDGVIHKVHLPPPTLPSYLPSLPEGEDVC